MNTSWLYNTANYLKLLNSGFNRGYFHGEHHPEAEQCLLGNNKCTAGTGFCCSQTEFVWLVE